MIIFFNRLPTRTSEGGTLDPRSWKFGPPRLGLSDPEVGILDPRGWDFGPRGWRFLNLSSNNIVVIIPLIMFVQNYSIYKVCTSTLATSLLRRISGVLVEADDKIVLMHLWVD